MCLRDKATLRAERLCCVCACVRVCVYAVVSANFELQDEGRNVVHQICQEPCAYGESLLLALHQLKVDFFAKDKVTTLARNRFFL